MRLLLAIATAFLALAAPAAAHIQVRPALVAPGDPVLFEVLVPGETDAKTIEVTLQVPKDVLPFSFEDPPGWERTNDEAADGSIKAIRWRGEQASDGLTRFTFLASTPEEDGEILWKALQTYDDGEIVALDRRAGLREPRRGDDRQRFGAAPERGRRGCGGRDRSRRGGHAGGDDRGSGERAGRG